MLCSISTSKRNSNWLDRLRSSKGFPISSTLQTLDQFLSSNPNPNPNPNPSPNPINKPQNIPNHNDHRLFDLMSNVLSDLFVMGSPPNPKRHPPKTSRKQANPRVCALSGSGSVNRSLNRSVSPPSADNSVVAEAAQKKRMKVRKRGLASDSDLLGFSRTEVTVIDTSSANWKSERVVFRKGAVWKVRDRKVLSLGRRRKKRKVGLVEKTGQTEQLASVGEGCTQTDKREDFRESDDQILIPRRSKFSRSPRMSASKNSSILRLKVVSKKNGALGPRNALKGK